MGSSSTKEQTGWAEKHCCFRKVCSTWGRKPQAPLQFHPTTKGSLIQLSEDFCHARRRSTFCNGITFTQRPIRIQEKVCLCITREAKKWTGVLRVGFTTVNPSFIDLAFLPQFVCPDLSQQPGFWAACLPEECAQEGDILKFWVGRKGEVFFKMNGKQSYFLFDGVPTNMLLWAIIDVYGNTEAVQLLGKPPSRKLLAGPVCPEQAASRTLLSSSVSSGLILDPTDDSLGPQTAGERRLSYPEIPGAEECLICCSRSINTVIYACGHMCMCLTCAQVARQTLTSCPLCRRTIKDIIQLFPGTGLTKTH
ncbi:E3 ubiquitin-protein ligase NEURL3 [Latimeria chalumnae]|uniref:E3 ubiquitin-protein ligase NEURL3 n=1 Tax=Latimeria chalumnae TaxID=7897 RepID=UPI00313CD188